MFKIGDRVRVVEETSHFHNREGTVINQKSDAGYIRVDLGTDYSYLFRPYELEKLNKETVAVVFKQTRPVVSYIGVYENVPKAQHFINQQHPQQTLEATDGKRFIYQDYHILVTEVL